MKIFKPDKYTDDYINSCNILHLCFKKLNNKLDKNIFYEIKLYLLEYAIGFASFNKKFIINNFEYNFEDRIGHPIDYIPRLLYKYPIIMKSNSTNKFSKIILNINNVPNIKIVDLTNLYNILLRRNIIRDNIINSVDFHELILLINKYICILNIELGIEKIYIKNNELLINNSVCKINSLIFYINNNKYDNIENIIIDNCGNYKIHSIYNFDKQYKMILLYDTNDILYIQLLRSILNNKVIINKIITLPPFVFINNNNFYKYELIALILYNNNIYSIIIKESNNKFYYYNEDNIYEINDDEFDELTAYNCTHLFYKKIN